MSRQRSLESIQNDEYVTIGELVRLTGARYSTLKYYSEVGLLLYEQEEENLTRRYRRIETIAQLERIQSLKEQGLTISQIKSTL